MAKKIILTLLTVTICFTAFVSCRKTTVNKGDQTLNYFPLQFGKYVTYDVDSITYNNNLSIHESPCSQLETRTQLKYAIDDTFRDSKKRLSYIMDVYSRPHDGATWQKVRVILLTPSTIAPLTTTPAPNTPTNNIIFTQEGSQFEKLVFPIVQGISWAGNYLVPAQDSSLWYFQKWNYTYQNLKSSFNDGYVNYDNTVTVLEDDETVNNQVLDSTQFAYRTYSKAVYAYNVGMVYKEWTHYIHYPYISACVNGFSVTMRAIDHN